MDFLRQPIMIGTVVRIWTPFVIFCIGVSALIGWIFDIDFLIRYFNDHVSIKPYTAITAIFAAGVIVNRGYVKKWLAIFILIIMGAQILDFFEVVVFGMSEYRHELFFNFPSWATIAMYITMVYCTQCYECSRRGGTIIMFLSVSAIIGHILDISTLYWYIPEVSTGMAAPTAIIGVHIGSWMLHGYNDTSIDITKVLVKDPNTSVA